MFRGLLTSLTALAILFGGAAACSCLIAGHTLRLPAEARVITPEISQGLRWKINGPAVKAEMQRQGAQKCDARGAERLLFFVML